VCSVSPLSGSVPTPDSHSSRHSPYRVECGTPAVLVEVIAVSKDQQFVNIYLLQAKEVDQGGHERTVLRNISVQQLELLIDPGYLLDMQNCIANAEEAIAHWEANIKELGGDRFSPETIKKGDFIDRGFGFREVVRVNKKSVTAKTQYSWTDVVPYTEIKRHLTAQQYADAKAKQAEATAQS